MRVPLFCALFLLATTAGATAQAGPVIHANAVIPRPAPTAPLIDWKDAAGRTTITLDVDGATLGGATLRGWKYAGTDANAPTVVFFNGNATTIDAADAFYRDVAAHGPSVVVFDYRGYGFSTGTPDIAAIQNDGLRIVDSLTRANAAQRIVVYGHSMGTAVATYVAAQRPVAGMILAAPFSNAPDEFPTFARLRGFPPTLIAAAVIAADAMTAFDQVGFVARSPAPLLVLHGTDDVQVPIELGRKVFAASASTKKRFVELTTDHDGVLTVPASIDAVRAFTASLQP